MGSVTHVFCCVTARSTHAGRGVCVFVRVCDRLMWDFGGDCLTLWVNRQNSKETNGEQGIG